MPPQKPLPRPSLTAKGPRVREEAIIFGRVIAEREYRVGRKTILLQIGAPHRASWKTAFYCPFRLVQKKETTLHRAFGVDAVQALMLAFDRIKTILEENWPTISYLGSEKPGDTGIYRRISGGGLDFDREVGILIEKAARARLRKLRTRSNSSVRRRFGSMRGKIRTTVALFEPLPPRAFDGSHRKR